MPLDEKKVRSHLACSSRRRHLPCARSAFLFFVDILVKTCGNHMASEVARTNDGFASVAGSTDGTTLCAFGSRSRVVFASAWTLCETVFPFWSVFPPYCGGIGADLYSKKNVFRLGHALGLDRPHDRTALD